MGPGGAGGKETGLAFRRASLVSSSAMGARAESAAEREAWRDVASGWRQLYGDFDRLGLSVQWHDFQSEQPLDWGRSFHPRSLEFCLNLEGRGEVGQSGSERSAYLPGNSGYYAIADDPLSATRRAKERHQFVTLEFSRDHLQKELAQNEPDLEPELRRVIFGDRQSTVVGPARAMSMEQRTVVASLVDPQVA